jgi:hypothetical protein
MALPVPIVGKLIELGGSIFDRLFPDKQAAEAAKAEFALALATVDTEKDREFHDFVVAYEGGGADVHPALQILRGSVRPVLTYFLAAAYVWGFAFGFKGMGTMEFTADQTSAAMDALFKLNLLSMGFWFGQRALENLGLNFTKMSEAKHNGNGKVESG